MSASANNNPVSIGFSGLLTILFIGLKLTGYVAWSWWWVLSPLWLPSLALLSLIVIALSITAATGGGR